MCNGSFKGNNYAISARFEAVAAGHSTPPKAFEMSSKYTHTLH
jgi:hypothetical protein